MQTERAIPVVLLLIVLLGAVTVPLLAKKRSSKPKRELIVLTGPAADTAQERGLCQTSVSAATLVESGQQYQEDTGTKRFTGSVLAYITPWNAAGYQTATRFRAKLTHVSPVWYQLRTDDAGSLVLVGGHEFNATWLQELREPLPERHKAQQLDGTQTHTAQQQAQTSTGQQQNSTDSHTGQQQDGSCQADAAAGLEGHPAATVPQADAAASCEVGAAAAGAPAGQLQQQEQQQQQQKEQELQQQQEDEQQEQEQQRQQQQQQQRRRLPAVVPRVIVELLPRELGLLLGRPGPAVERLVAECEARGYDGLVLEAWTSWAALGGFEDAAFREAALSFIRQLGDALQASANKQLLLAVPPVLPAHPSRPFARRELLAELVSGGHVDGLSVMTYDHASGVPGPNAPLGWQKQNLQLLLGDADGAEGVGHGRGTESGGGRGKEQAMRAEAVLLGMPFYGYDYTEHVKTRALGMEAVTSQGFLEQLQQHLPELRWDAQAAEHSVAFRQGRVRHTVWAPTHAAVAARLEMVAGYGAGVSIWELGQGLDSFMDLL